MGSRPSELHVGLGLEGVVLVELRRWANPAVQHSPNANLALKPICSRQQQLDPACAPPEAKAKTRGVWTVSLLAADDACGVMVRL
jgi:hypothetical protein